MTMEEGEEGEEGVGAMTPVAQASAHPSCDA